MTKKEAYDPKTDLRSAIRLLNGMLDKSISFVRHLDTQSNIIIGISMAVFVYSIPQYQLNPERLFLLVMGLFSAVSAIVALMAIHPPRFMRKRGQEESLMYTKRIADFKTNRLFNREIGKMMGDIDKIQYQYSTEIYNLAKYYYRPKRRLFNSARNIFLAGILIGLIVFFVE